MISQLSKYRKEIKGKYQRLLRTIIACVIKQAMIKKELRNSLNIKIEGYLNCKEAKIEDAERFFIRTPFSSIRFYGKKQELDEFIEILYKIDICRITIDKSELKYIITFSW